MRRLYSSAHKSCFNRQLAVATINEHAKLDLGRPAMTEKSFECGARGSASVKNVIYQNDLLPGDRKTDVGLLNNGLRQGGKVIPVSGDVETPHRNRTFLDALNPLANSLGQKHAAAANSDQDQVLRTVIFLDDFMHQAHQRALNF